MTNSYTGKKLKRASWHCRVLRPEGAEPMQVGGWGAARRDLDTTSSPLCAPAPAPSSVGSFCQFLNL